jgi:Histidine kinase-, DNA gyrase B-, and HSP90-like ATPase
LGGALAGGLAGEDRPVTLKPTRLIDLVQAEAENAPRRPTVEGSDVMVSLDARLMARVVRNLLVNAHRHARSVVAATVQVDGHRVWLHVDDDGPGIPPGSRAEIFERFSRLDEARNTDGGGSGLGLAIVASIAAAHGGGVMATARESRSRISPRLNRRGSRSNTVRRLMGSRPGRAAGRLVRRMKVLLDTHVLAWLLIDPDLVPGPMMADIESSSELYVSAASTWKWPSSTRRVDGPRS